jgi:hypothetical protein
VATKIRSNKRAIRHPAPMVRHFSLSLFYPPPVLFLSSVHFTRTVRTHDSLRRRPASRERSRRPPHPRHRPRSRSLPPPPHRQRSIRRLSEAQSAIPGTRVTVRPLLQPLTNRASVPRSHIAASTRSLNIPEAHRRSPSPSATDAELIAGTHPSPPAAGSLQVTMSQSECSFDFSSFN